MAVRRRTVLAAGGAGALAAAGAAVGVATGELPGSAAVRRRMGWTGPDGQVPGVPAGRVRTTRERSAARRADVDLVTMVPDGVAGDEAAELPVCLALHGRDSSARGLIGLGVPRFLTAAARAGAPPFAVVAVDGGSSSYWTAGHGADPQAMLARELPGWLVARGLGLRERGVPRAVFGISMGGFGSLVYARRRAADGAPLSAVAALSPALFRGWPDAHAVTPFSGEAEWAANEPLRHLGALGLPPHALGVWCGREDPFFPAALELARRADAGRAAFGHGAHDPGYWRRVLPEALRFVGGRISA